MHRVCVIMTHTSLQLHLAILLQKPALLLQSENLKTIFSFRRHDLDTAFITSSYAHSLCDHDAHKFAF